MMDFFSRQQTPPETRLKIAFVFISVIPLLICCYLIVVRFLSLVVLAEVPGVFFMLMVLAAVAGLLLGRRLIRQVLHQLKQTNTHLEKELTERRRVEYSLQKAHADLQKSHEELRAVQLQLIHAEKLKTVGRMAAGVAHEVKNPLEIIRMGVGDLSRHLKEGDAYTQEVLTDLTDATQMADMVVRGLLDFSVSRKLEVGSEDMALVIEQVLRLLRHELKRAQVSLQKDLQSPLPRIKLDKHKIEQVLVNLVMNAIHAMPNGGTLMIKSYARPFEALQTQLKEQGSTSFGAGDLLVVTEISDTGDGLSEEAALHIFDPFFSTKPTGVGTGLGLTVVKKIIDLHHGMVRLKNRTGGGVTVTLTFKAENED